MITAPDGNRPVQRSQQELDALWERDFEVDLNAEVPTVLVVHALTADAAAGEEEAGGNRSLVPDAIDTKSTRVLCFNTRSCYGSYGPMIRLPSLVRPCPRWTRLARRSDYQWDQARAIIRALDALNITRVDRVFGGSIGGMICFALQVLQPERFRALTVIGTDTRATPWVIGWNQVGRQAILNDPEQGLNLARQLAHLSYRAIPSEIRQSRDTQQMFGPSTVLHGSYLAITARS